MIKQNRVCLRLWYVCTSRVTTVPFLNEKWQNWVVQHRTGCINTDEVHKAEVAQQVAQRETQLFSASHTRILILYVGGQPFFSFFVHPFPSSVHQYQSALWTGLVFTTGAILVRVSQGRQHAKSIKKMHSRDPATPRKSKHHLSPFTCIKADSGNRTGENTPQPRQAAHKTPCYKIEKPRRRKKFLAKVTTLKSLVTWENHRGAMN